MQAQMLEERTLAELDHVRLSRVRRRQRDRAHAPFAGSPRPGLDVKGSHLRTFENGELFRWLDQLRENERDLRRRLAARVAALGDPAAPISDPIYQTLSIALAGLEAQRVGAESELARRVAFFVD